MGTEGQKQRKRGREGGKAREVKRGGYSCQKKGRKQEKEDSYKGSKGWRDTNGVHTKTKIKNKGRKGEKERERERTTNGRRKRGGETKNERK